MGCGSSKSTEVADTKNKKDQTKPVANSNPSGEGNGIAKKEDTQPNPEEKVESKQEEKKIEEVQEDKEEGDPPTLDMRKGSPKKNKVKD